MKKSDSKAKIIIIIVGALIVLSTVGTMSVGNVFKPNSMTPTSDFEPTSEEFEPKGSYLRPTISERNGLYYLTTQPLGYIIVSNLPDRIIYRLEGKSDQEVDMSAVQVVQLISGENAGKKMIKLYDGTWFVYDSLEVGSYRAVVVLVYGNDEIIIETKYSLTVSERLYSINAIDNETGEQIDGMTKESDWSITIMLSENELPLVPFRS